MSQEIFDAFNFIQIEPLSTTDSKSMPNVSRRECHRVVLKFEAINWALIIKNTLYYKSIDGRLHSTEMST